MRPTPRHRLAETQFRQLVGQAKLAAPDDVEFTRTSLVFRWHEPKLAVIVELDDSAAGAGVAGTMLREAAW
jgi:hypothetical protein